MASELKNGGGVRAIALSRTVATHERNQSSLFPPSVSVNYRGHRAYIDNPKLIATVARKAPLPRGHRAFSGGKAEWR